jgi:hypothetical protein
MVAQVFLEIGQAEQELKEFVVLREGVCTALLRERLHGKICIAQQPIHSVRIYRLALAAEFDRPL